jgi:hypothetical protein
MIERNYDIQTDGRSHSAGSTFGATYDRSQRQITRLRPEHKIAIPARR